jgi:hypothetical protein
VVMVGQSPEGSQAEPAVHGPGPVSLLGKWARAPEEESLFKILIDRTRLGEPETILIEGGNAARE